MCTHGRSLESASRRFESRIIFSGQRPSIHRLHPHVTLSLTYRGSCKLLSVSRLPVIVSSSSHHRLIIVSSASEHRLVYLSSAVAVRVFAIVAPAIRVLTQFVIWFARVSPRSMQMLVKVSEVSRRNTAACSCAVAACCFLFMCCGCNLLSHHVLP